MLVLQWAMGPVLQDCPPSSTSEASGKPRLLPCLDSLAINRRFPRSPWGRSIDLLEQLTGILRNILIIILLWKDLTQDRPMEEVHGARYGESVRIFHAIWRVPHHFSHTFMFTDKTAFWMLSFCLFVFMEVLLHRHDWLNHWPLVVDSTFQPLSSWDWKFQPLNHMVCSPGNQSLSLGIQSHLIR